MKFFLQFQVNIQCLDPYFCKILEKFKKYSLSTPETKKIIKKFQPQITRN